MEGKSMKLNHRLIIWFVLLQTCCGFFFTQEKQVTATAQISEECKEKAKNGDCEFFDCFEERFPCGESGYAISYGKKYCLGFQNRKDRFTQEGQDFIEKLAKCQMKHFLPVYSHNRLNCNQNYEDSFLTMGSCFVPSGFCEMVISNFRAIASTIEPTDMVNYRLVREVFNAGKNCPVDLNSAIVRQFMDFKRKDRDSL